MWIYEKKLQYPVRVNSTNPQLAQLLLTQYGGADGELAAALRYLNQRYTMPTNNTKGLLTDIGTDASEMFRFSKRIPSSMLKEASAFLPP